MFENIKKLYKHYGGVLAIVKSYYFWISVLLAALSYRSIYNFSWVDETLSVVPSLTGFTIAAFAIIIAMLEPKMLQDLMATDENGKSPIVGIAASIGHAVLIQISSIIFAISSNLADLSKIVENISDCIVVAGYSPTPLIQVMEWVAIFASATGLTLSYYGIMLVLAAIFSIFRMQIIISSTKESTGMKEKNKETSEINKESDKHNQ